MVENIKITNVVDGVAANDLCVGCGVCSSLCPKKCLKIKVSSIGNLQVYMNGQCNECGLCLRVCPFFKQKKNIDNIAAEMFSGQQNNQWIGNLGYYQSCWSGYSCSVQQRLSSASGGLLTEMLIKLFEDKDIDSVGLVKMSKEDNRYCKFTVAGNIDEIIQGSGSAYYPTEISGVLNEVMASQRKWAIVALPCLAYSIRLAQNQIPKLKENIKYVFSLACGTLPNDYLTDFLISQSGAEKNKIDRITFRGKHNRTTPRNFFFEAYDISGHILGNPVDFTNLPLRLWNMGYFRTTACNFCEDVFGETADASFMDAWLEQFDNDPKGTNLVIIRNHRLETCLAKMHKDKKIHIESISGENVLKSQNGAMRKKVKSVPLRIYWANKTGRPYPTCRSRPNKGKLDDRYNWYIQRSIQKTSKLIWPLIGNRFGWRFFLLCMSPWFFASRIYDIVQRLKRILHNFR